jgi:hypothetical protein
MRALRWNGLAVLVLAALLGSAVAAPLHPSTHAGADFADCGLCKYVKHSPAVAAPQTELSVVTVLHGETCAPPAPPAARGERPAYSTRGPPRIA